MEKLYVGCDLHSNNNYFSIIDKEDQKVWSGRLKNSLPVILEKLEPYQARIEGIVVELTFNWYWLVDGLMEHCYPVHLSNPGANEQYGGLKNVNDKNDARWLANLLRLDILKEGYIMDKPLRALRDLCRKRIQLVEMRTANILSIQNLFARNLGNIKAQDYGKMKFDELSLLFGDVNLARAVTANDSIIAALNREIQDLEKMIFRQIHLDPQFQKLKSIRGVGDILAQTMKLEVGDVRRFEQVGDYVSYCRLVSTDKFSNSKKKGKGNSKNGNKYLSWAYTEAAISAIHWNPSAKKFYEKKKRKTMPVIAIRALAHKLARASYYIMRDQVDFDSKKLFGY